MAALAVLPPRPLARRTLLVGAGTALACGTLARVGAGPSGPAVPVAAAPDALRGLVPLLERPVATIAEVAQTLGAIGDHVAAVSPLGERDGIACFSRLYTDITQTVDARPFADRAFLVRLDIEFARRYLAALQAHLVPGAVAPAAWAVLFDRRTDPSVAPARFAAAGVNAHINYDLAAALLATWPDYPPDEIRHRDYSGVDDVFAARMGYLRARFGSPLSGGPFDPLGQGLGDVLVRSTRGLAWELAMAAWTATDRAAAAAELDAKLDRVTARLGRALLDVPVLPL